MKLRAKNLPIGTGDVVIAVLREKDATQLDLRPADRILLKYNAKKVVATVDIIMRKDGHLKSKYTSKSLSFLSHGQIGLFVEAHDALQVKSGQEIEILSANRPLSLSYIKKKLRGEKLSPAQMHAIIQDVTKGNLSDVELTYFVAASYLNELDMNEITALTHAMVASGETLKLPKKIIVDKHCIGGVAANRTSMLIVPILAAAGLTIPKTSSRSITSAAGTADTMEVLCPVVFSLSQMKKIAMKTGGCLVWGGAMSLAPADDKIIQVEHPVALDPVGQLLASIMAKKKSVSATHVLIDIPVGRGAKIQDTKKARDLGQKFKELGKRLGMKIALLYSDGSQPVGNGIGPTLEARDVLWTLKNSSRGSVLLKNKAILMSGILLELTGKAKRGKGLDMAREIVETGKAYAKFIEIVKAQGGKEVKPEHLRLARRSYTVHAKKSGRVTHVDNGTMNKVARIAGAPHDQEAGVYLYHHIGEKVHKGEKLFTIYSDNPERLQYAMQVIKKMDGVEIR